MQTATDNNSCRSRRINYFEWLRVIAAAAVVLLHVFATVCDNSTVEQIGFARATIWSTIQLIATRWAVPIFLMITGALLLDSHRDYGWSKAFRYVKRMLSVLVTFGFLYCVTEEVFVQRSISSSVIISSGISLIEGRSWAHMWYVYTLIGLYLLMPLYKAFINQASRRDELVLLLILGITTLVIPTINSASGLQIDNLVWVTSSSFYLILGHYAHNHLVLSKQIVSVGLIALLASILIKMTYLSHGDWGGWIENPADPLIALWSLVIFLAAKQYFDRSYGCFISKLSSASFGIYLVHPVILNMLFKVVGITPQMMSPVLYETGVWLVAFLGSLAIVLTLKRLPYFRRIL